MYRYQLQAPLRPIDRPGTTRTRLEIRLDTHTPEEDGPLLFVGPKPELKILKEKLLLSYGFRGRPMELVTSFRDLQCAIVDPLLQPYEAELL